MFGVYLESLVGKSGAPWVSSSSSKSIPFPDQGFHCFGIDLECLVESFRGISAVVLFRQQVPGEILSLPAIGIRFQRVLVHFIQYEAELLRFVIPASVLGSRLTDEAKQLGIGNSLSRRCWRSGCTL